MNMQAVALPRDGFIRPRSAALFCGVSLATYWRWASEGRVPRPIAISPSVSVVRNADLLDWQTDPIAWAAKVKPGEAANDGEAGA